MYASTTALLLTGCPQMLGDEFRLHRDGTPEPPDAAPADPRTGSGGSSSGAAPVGGSDPSPNGDTPTATAGGGAGSSAPVGSGGGADAANSPSSALRALLAHRYEFGGAGTAAIDSVGGADGIIVGTALTGAGAVTLSGGSYVDLPNGLLSALQAGTLEVWLAWNGGGNYQRIFDFGSNDNGEGAQGLGETYLFLSAAWTSTLRGGCTKTGIAGITWVEGVSALPIGVRTHVALVIDSGADRLSLYVDGQPDATTALTVRLAELDDVNNWLGRAQIVGHPSFDGFIEEFRIYRAALSPEQIRLSFELGPDHDFGL